MPEPHPPLSDRFRAAFLEACALDVATPKPGNVSVHSPGHGMSAAQFIASADAALDALFARGARVGQRILDAVTRTRDAVGCNTNLGIVLLVAPLAAALEEAVERPVGQRVGDSGPAVSGPNAPAASRAVTAPGWRAALDRVLEALDVEDARLAYRAIALANPGGLGDAPEQSVHAPPTIGLRDAMRLASERDSIARQYANGFADIFDTGLAAAREAPPDAPDVAMLNVFLAFLGGWPDSHIVRKHGLALAQSVTLAAREQHARWRRASAGTPSHAAYGTPPGVTPLLPLPPLPPLQARRTPADARLDAWDAQLKARAINPGTSADLAVATLFVARCIDADARPRAL